MNEEKTFFFFNKKTSVANRRRITVIFGDQPIYYFDKYLSLPTMVGKSRMCTFKTIKDIIWSHMSNWKVKFLFHAGKEILLKAIVQTILTYTMSLFKLQKDLCCDKKLIP